MSAAQILTLLSLTAPADLGSVIVFGGGWGAEGTQASIELHVIDLVERFRDHKPVVLFASGQRDVRDVQIAAVLSDETTHLLGLLFSRSDNLHVDYRASKMTSRSPATKVAFLETLSRTEGDSSPTLIFGAGHGAPASEDRKAAIELWGSQGEVSVDDLAGALDPQKRKAMVAFFLGHCHSGAFLDVMYRGADPKRGLARPARCAFAAVPADRQASGCTPDVGDPSARAYLALIAEAWAKPDQADFDGNRQVSLAEAHAYAQLKDETVDVPVSTRTAFVAHRQKSRWIKYTAASLTDVDRSARPSDRRLLESLWTPAQQPTPDVPKRDRARHVSRELARIEREEDALETQVIALEDQLDLERRTLLDVLLTEHPELANPYHPIARRLLAEAEAWLGPLRARGAFDPLLTTEKRLGAAEDQRFQLERERARLERWILMVETIANEKTLRKDPSARRDLDELERCESIEPQKR